METIKRKFAVLISIICFSTAFCFAADSPSSASIREFFPAQSGTASMAHLPTDSVLGMTASGNATSYHMILCKALESEYGIEWAETFLDPSTKASLVRLYGSFFSQVLPVGNALFSIARENEDKSVTIGARIGDEILEFVISDGLIVSIRKVKN